MATLIKVADEIQSSVLKFHKDYDLIYTKISNHIFQNKNIILDFSGIIQATDNSLHYCIGAFFEDPRYIRDFITHVIIKADDKISSKINNVINSAKSKDNFHEDE